MSMGNFLSASFIRPDTLAAMTANAIPDNLSLLPPGSIYPQIGAAATRAMNAAGVFIYSLDCQLFLFSACHLPLTFPSLDKRSSASRLCLVTPATTGAPKTTPCSDAAIAQPTTQSQ